MTRRFNLKTDVAGDGGTDKAPPECARPRAQQLASFKLWNIFQALTQSYLAAAGTAALQQRRDSTSEFGFNHITQAATCLLSAAT